MRRRPCSASRKRHFAVGGLADFWTLARAGSENTSDSSGIASSCGSLTTASRRSAQTSRLRGSYRKQQYELATKKMNDEQNLAKPNRDYEKVGEITSIYPRGKTWWVNYQFEGQHRKSLKTSSK